MGPFLNWMTLFGLGLIAGGVLLLVLAYLGAKHRTGPARASADARRSARWRSLDRHRPDAPQPDIRRSALLADTVGLDEVRTDQTR